MSIFDYAASAGPAKVVIKTPMMEQALQETLSGCGQGTGALWSGAAGAGKTTTARWFEEQINTAFLAGASNRFRCVYWESPNFHGKSRDGEELLSGLYQRVTDHPMDPGTVRGRGVEGRVNLLLAAIRKRKNGLLILDEAQRLSDAALETLVHLGNRSTEGASSPLSMVLVGSGRLPSLLAKNPHLSRRFRTRIAFTDLDESEVARFAVKLYPQCFDRQVPKEILTYLVKQTAGNPAELILLLGRAEFLLNRIPDERFLTLTHLEGAVLHQRFGEMGTRKLESRGYAPAFGPDGVVK